MIFHLLYLEKWGRNWWETTQSWVSTGHATALLRGAPLRLNSGLFSRFADLERARASGTMLLWVPISASLLASCVTLNEYFSSWASLSSYLPSWVYCEDYVRLQEKERACLAQGEHPVTAKCPEKSQHWRWGPQTQLTVTGLGTEAALSATASSAPGGPVCFCFPSFSQLPPLLTAAVLPAPHPQVSH